MSIVDFSNWLLSNGTNKKVASDIVSRLKRINRELMEQPTYTTIAMQYQKDKCEELTKSFGKDNYNNIFPYSKLPFGSPSIASYKHALKKYLLFLEDR